MSSETGLSISSPPTPSPPKPTNLRGNHVLRSAAATFLIPSGLPPHISFKERTPALHQESLKRVVSNFAKAFPLSLLQTMHKCKALFFSLWRRSIVCVWALCAESKAIGGRGGDSHEATVRNILSTSSPPATGRLLLQHMHMFHLEQQRPVKLVSLPGFKGLLNTA